MRPRSMRCCSSIPRAFKPFSRNEEASKIVHREVNASSSANSTTTSPYRRTIGRFIVWASFELSQFEAANQRGGVAFRAQRVIEQRPAAFRRQGGSAHARDEVAAVEVQVSGQPVGNAAEHRDQTAA